MRNRTIIHSDLNGFYASVECLYDPKLRDVPMVVGGDAEQRHGIVLASNQLAKQQGTKTGMVLWQAKQLCPQLVSVKPHYNRYLYYAQLARQIYNEYTPLVEPYGLDEAFADLTGSVALCGDGPHIADTIRQRVKAELGLTVSVGVSFNKVFAKLGSDMKKPDATTVITPDNFKEKVWPLPVGDLLFVGPATVKKLRMLGVYTIGDLAGMESDILRRRLGVAGSMLWNFANGLDDSQVRPFEALKNDDGGMKSIGHSTTTPRDLASEQDVSITVMLLCESVATRLRDHQRLCKTVQVYFRDCKLESFDRQQRFPEPTQLARELHAGAMSLYRRHRPQNPLRTIGVRACDLIPQDEGLQLSMIPEERKRQEWMALEHTMDDIRFRYGHEAISRGFMMTDKRLGKGSPKDDHMFTFPAHSI